MTHDELDAAIGGLNRSFGQPAYEAFDVTWIAVIKIANTLPGEREHDRLVRLLELLPEEAALGILQRPEVDTLLNLQPPLETLLSSRYERLNAGAWQEWNAPLWEQPLALFDAMFAGGVRTHYVAVAVCAPLLIATPGSLVVTISVETPEGARVSTCVTLN